MTKINDILSIDTELKTWGVPIRDRPLKVFKRMFGPVRDYDLRVQLFKPITDWYLSIYGEEVQWDGILGTFPILIREQLYVGKALYIVEDRPGFYKEQIIGLPSTISDTFDDSEFRYIAGQLMRARVSYGALRNLDIDDHILGSEASELFQMGFRDLDSAVVLLSHSKNIQGSIVASHEAAEKFLKIALLKSVSTKHPRKFLHDIPALFAHLSTIEPRYAWLLKPAHNLQKLSPSMDMRYKVMQRSVEHAVSAFNSSLYVCGALAEIWLMDHARGDRSPVFKECHFYKNGSGRSYYCKKVSGEYATLTFFNSDPRWGSQMADITMNILQSSLYLEVDEAEDTNLRSQLIAMVRNPGRLMTPEEIGLQMENGDEGAFNTIMIKKKVQARESKD